MAYILDAEHDQPKQAQAQGVRAHTWWPTLHSAAHLGTYMGDWARRFQSSQTRRLAGNTHLVRIGTEHEDTRFILRLHATDLVTVEADNVFTFRADGWYTKLTVDRLISMVPNRIVRFERVAGILWISFHALARVSDGDEAWQAWCQEPTVRHERSMINESRRMAAILMGATCKESGSTLRQTFDPTYAEPHLIADLPRVAMWLRRERKRPRNKSTTWTHMIEPVACVGDYVLVRVRAPFAEGFQMDAPSSGQVNEQHELAFEDDPLPLLRPSSWVAVATGYDILRRNIELRQGITRLITLAQPDYLRSLEWAPPGAVRDTDDRCVGCMTDPCDLSEEHLWWHVRHRFLTHAFARTMHHLGSPPSHASPHGYGYAEYWTEPVLFKRHLRIYLRRRLRAGPIMIPGWKNPPSPVPSYVYGASDDAFPSASSLVSGPYAVVIPQP